MIVWTIRSISYAAHGESFNFDKKNMFWWFLKLFVWNNLKFFDFRRIKTRFLKKQRTKSTKCWAVVSANSSAAHDVRELMEEINFQDMTPSFAKARFWLDEPSVSHGPWTLNFLKMSDFCSDISKILPSRRNSSIRHKNRKWRMKWVDFDD